MTMALANKENDTVPHNRLDAMSKPDLSEAETAVLRALLLDPVSSLSKTSRTATTAANKTLDDEILFSLPFHYQDGKPTSERRNTTLLQLWHAFEDGVKPKTLVRQASMHRQKSKTRQLEKQKSLKQQESQDDESHCSVKSDEEVRVEKRELDDDDELSTCSSWNEEEGGHEHFDSWQVLKDEYAGDFGFDYKERLSLDVDMEDQGHVFSILGTSANDAAAHPHVLSPPLMDALMSFLPESLENENFWLKYSLVRDGSSMNTLKHYVRASANTILAIETTTGEVFGAFTTSPWRTQFGFFGEGKGSFLWRMRYNRHLPCHSLFEQAQLETEIDVYEYSGLNKLIQHCSHNEIAIGGGNILEQNDIDSDDDVTATSSPIDIPNAPSPPPAELQLLEDAVGFGIAVDEFLARGTTSPCATFRNPSLLNKLAETETFEIANLEVWTLTPGYNVNSAEKLEMTKYFVDQSSHSESVHSIYSDIAGSYTGTSPLNSMTAADVAQASFYRRVGENDQSEEQRQRWQYANMMGMM